MKRRLNTKIGIVLFFTLVLTGCTTMRIESNKDPSYNANIHRLVLLENMDTTLIASFDNSFSGLMNNCNVTIKIIKAPATDNFITQAYAIDFGGSKPDAVLAMRMTSMALPNDLRYELILRDDSKKKVWKSLMDFVIGNVVIANRGELLAVDLVTQLNKDGIVSGCTPEDL